MNRTCPISRWRLASASGTGPVYRKSWLEAMYFSKDVIARALGAISWERADRHLKHRGCWSAAKGCNGTVDQTAVKMGYLLKSHNTNKAQIVETISPAG